MLALVHRMPRGSRWYCPRHVCAVCQGASTHQCAECPTAFCRAHATPDVVRPVDEADAAVHAAMVAATTAQPVATGLRCHHCWTDLEVHHGVARAW